MEYVIKFKRKKDLLWSKRKVAGHRYMQEVDKMVLHFSASKIEEIPEWSKHYVILGADFFVAQKEQMEKETGVEVSIRGV